MKKFSSAGIEVMCESTISRKDTVYRTRVPSELEVITGQIRSVKFSGTNVTVNCGGKLVMGLRSKRIYVPIELIRTLKLAHGDVLMWKLSYTSTGIKITVGGQKR